MKKLRTHSKSSLFLMEMILSIFILVLAATVCLQIFAAAKIQRQKARDLNHIQELTTSIGEMLEGHDAGNLESIQYFYDSDWKQCSKDLARYILSVQFTFTENIKKADILFLDNSGETLYSLAVSFPQTQNS